MQESSSPSPEKLSAFFDRELPPEEHEAIAKQIEENPELAALIQDFELISELGPRIDDQLPGDAYWADLPDRILVRIAAEEAAEARPVVGAKEPSFWQRLLQPQGGWRWATSAIAAVAVVGAGWLTLRTENHPGNPVADAGLTGGVTNTASEPAFLQPLESIDHTDKDLDPDQFAQRVIRTLDPRNPGTSLDIASGQANVGMNQGASVGSQVNLSLESRREAERLINYSCGEPNPMEQTFVFAMKAEEVGRFDLAKAGYQIIQRLSQPGQPIYCEADSRLTYITWRERMESVGPRQRMVELSKMSKLADVSFEQWEKTQHDMDCAKAWCMNKALARITRDVVEVPEAPEFKVASSRVVQLQPCVAK